MSFSRDTNFQQTFAHWSIYSLLFTLRHFLKTICEQAYSKSSLKDHCDYILLNKQGFYGLCLRITWSWFSTSGEFLTGIHAFAHWTPPFFPHKINLSNNFNNVYSVGMSLVFNIKFKSFWASLVQISLRCKK